MQELTFEQVESVSGGFVSTGTLGSDLISGPFIIDDFTAHNLHDDSTDAQGGTGGTTIVGSLIGGTNYVGSLILAGVSGTASALLGLVGLTASTAFSATQEGRDEMRVQNHPATRDLYNADGTKK